MSNQPVFREQTRQPHGQRHERLALPRLVRPQAFYDLWVLILILIVAGLMIAFWPISEMFGRG